MSQTGELSGVVTDPSGAVVPNAQITLSNTATGDQRTTVTTGSGIYRFSALPVGNYTLEASPTGFKSTKVTNIVVSVGTVTSRDIHLELGSTSDQMIVEAGAQLAVPRNGFRSRQRLSRAGRLGTSHNILFVYSNGFL